MDENTIPTRRDRAEIRSQRTNHHEREVGTDSPYLRLTRREGEYLKKKKNEREKRGEIGSSGTRKTTGGSGGIYRGHGA
jgi:hypothetical protein